SAAEANSLYQTSLMVLIGLLVGSAIIAGLAATWIVLGISKGLNRVKTALTAASMGDLDQKVEVTSNDEIKDLVDTVNRLVESLRGVAVLAGQVADGDLSVKPQMASDKDEIGRALQRMVESLSASAAIAEKIAAGDLTVAPKPMSDKDTLGLALQQMVTRLRDVISDVIASA